MNDSPSGVRSFLKTQPSMGKPPINKKVKRLNPAPNLSASRNAATAFDVKKSDVTDKNVLQREAGNPNDGDMDTDVSQSSLENLNMENKSEWESANRFKVLNTLTNDKESHSTIVDANTQFNVLEEIIQRNLSATNNSHTTARLPMPGKVISNAASNTSDNTPTGPKPAESSLRPTPFFIWHQLIADTIKLVKDYLKIGNFYTKRISNIKHILYLHNFADYNTVKETLEKAKTRFYTYTPKGSKKLTFLLKGLDANLDTSQLLDDLTSINVSDLVFSSVKPFTTRHSKLNNINLPIYLVQLEANSKAAQLKKIVHINCQKIH